ncbi:hypothetical protein NM688_g4700 [Phlebia brevispora]|uniref:Uncharacterized protein n=1 Tax=Phlebia brevispora TaxID=194682 RepID=A0ACC1T275_9APHY|nr:hypothetical protein NM688_g4700 [Phlebia brevispora]
MHWCSFGVAGYHDCDHCTAQTNNLSVHEIRIHTNIKYPCDFCAWEFVWTDPKQHHNHKVHMHGYVPNARKERDPATYIRGGNRPRKATSKISFHSYARESSVSSCASSSRSSPGVSPDSRVLSPASPTELSISQLLNTTPSPQACSFPTRASDCYGGLPLSELHLAPPADVFTWRSSDAADLRDLSHYLPVNIGANDDDGMLCGLLTPEPTPQLFHCIRQSLFDASTLALLSSLSSSPATQSHPFIYGKDARLFPGILPTISLTLDNVIATPMHAIFL